MESPYWILVWGDCKDNPLHDTLTAPFPSRHIFNSLNLDCIGYSKKMHVFKFNN